MMPPPQLGAPFGEGNLTEPSGITWEDPPPEMTPTSAWPPITAILPAPLVRGKSPGLVFSSTMACSATRPATRESARVSSPPGCSGWSNTPSANRLRSTRRAMSWTRADGILPSATAAVRGASKNTCLSASWPDSWSRPAAAEASECTAPQSDITQPG